MLPNQKCLLSFLLFVISSRTTPVTAQSTSTFPCTKFWPTLQENDHNITLPCSHLPGYPTTIDNIPVSVIHTTDFDPTTSSMSTILYPLLTETFTTTITTFTSLGLPSGFSPLILILTNTTTTNKLYELETTLPEYPPSPCRIQANTPLWLADLSSPTPELSHGPGPSQQKLAHEIYHCIQKWNLPQPDEQQQQQNSAPYPTWVIEGSAMYFSNLAYPSVDLEWADYMSYNPDIPLYAHDNLVHGENHGGKKAKSAYAAGLFFQFLESLIGSVGVNSFVLGNTEGNGQLGGLEERRRLSREVVAVLGFEKFAEAFTLGRAFPLSLGLGIGIRDTGGRYIPSGVFNGAPHPASLVMTDKEGKEGRVDVSSVPFTIMEFVFEIDGGQIVMLSLAPGMKPKAGGKVKYRVGRNQKEWMDVPMGGALGSQGFIVTPCEESVDVFLLFVSTGDVDVEKSTVLVKQFYKDEDCPCKDGKKRKGVGLKDGCKKRKEKEKEDEEEEEEEELVGNCKGSNIPTDECFLNTRRWALDIPSTKELVEKKVKETLPADGVTGVIVGVTGSGDFVISGEEGKNVTMTYKDLRIETVVTVEGMSIPVTVKIDGVAEANMYTESKDKEGGKGSVCLVMYAGHGSAVGSNPLFGDLINYDLSEKDWISQDWDVTYTCGGGKFSIHGVLNGATTFGPFVYNAVA